MLESIVRLLAENPLLLLFVVCAVGYPVGRIRIRGASLGTASVLFAGIAIGAIDPRLKLPDIIYFLGLSVLLYTLGLASSRGFFAAFNRAGLRNTALAIAALTVATGVAAWYGSSMHIAGSRAAGMFSGALSNAPGLASVIDAMRSAAAPNRLLAGPVVGYSLAYPLGVLGPMLLMALARAVFRVDLQAEAMQIPSYRRSVQPIEVETVRVSNPDAVGQSLDTVAHGVEANVVFGRIRRAGHDVIATADQHFELGDLVTITGYRDELQRLATRLGEFNDRSIQHDRNELDYRRIFVSKPDVVGRPLRELALPKRLGAIMTQVRRGDLEFIPDGDTVLELGDRVRVFTRRENLTEASNFFGDSYKALGEADFMALCFGLLAGILLGLVPLPVPGITLRLGFAGGPLLMGLLLGRVGRTGPIIWNLPYSANLTLRNFGLLLFAAGIGTRAGFDFYHTLARGEGLDLFIGGLLVTVATGMVVLVIGYRLLKIPLNILFGIYVGAQTQPVNLAFALDQTKNDVPAQSYATVFPAATIFKIVAAQVLYAFLR